MIVTIEYTIDYNQKEGSSNIVEVDVPKKYTKDEVYAQLVKMGEIDDRDYRYFEVSEVE
jgi:hypothetical protein